MKSTLDKLDGLARKLNIELPPESVQAGFDKMYREIQRDVEIKGFRKGKAPLAQIKSLYGEKVKSDVLQDLVSEHYAQALQEHSLEPIGYPKINFDQGLEENKAFSFTAELEVRPEVVLNKYEGLEVKKEEVVIDEKQVDQVLENIQQSQSETNTVFEDRPAREGDIAELDFSGSVDDQPLEGAQAQGHLLELGSKRFIPGFEEGVIGMKAGDQKTLELSFPEDYHNRELAGRPIRFEVTLKAIKAKSLPDLNDELAKKVGGFETLEALKEDIRKDLAQREEKRVRDELRNQIIKALVQANPVEVPEGLKQEQKEMIIEDVRKRMADQGLPPEEFEEYKRKWDSDFNDSAALMVQSTFLVDALAQKLQLNATHEDLNQRLQEYAQQTGIELERIREFYGEQNRMSRLAFQITEEKVVNYLLDKAQITPGKVEASPSPV